MQWFKGFCLILIITGLSGCAFAPGQYMHAADLKPGGGDPLGQVELIPITASSLQQAAKKTPPPAIPQPLLDYRPPVYHIGAGDVLFITVWDHPELTAPSGAQQQIYANGRLVKADGMLFYPFVGNIKAAGLTLDELRSTITSSIARYVEQPQVDVNVITYGSQRVWLNGAFLEAGTQSITVIPLTLAEAMGKARIDPLQADLSTLVLRRDGMDYRLDLDALRRGPLGPDDIYLKNGDHIYLAYNDRKQVFVVGEVLRPQALTFKTSTMTLTQALGQSGGLNPGSAKGQAVYVIRPAVDIKNRNTVYQLDARSPASYLLADSFLVHPGDVVFVGAAGITRWNRFISQLLPFSSIITNAAIANNNLGSSN